MSYKPMIFSTPMVQAILDGGKTQTRRVIKPQPHEEAVKAVDLSKCAPVQLGDIIWVRETWKPSPYEDGTYAYKADRLPEPAGCQYLHWRPSIHMPKAAARIFLLVTGVRVERVQDISEEDAIAEGICKILDNLSDDMYREWRSRIVHYQGIDHDPGEKENQPYKNYLWHGLYGQYGRGNKKTDVWEYQYSGYELARDSYSSLWESINGAGSWEANPWVWVYSFERIERPNDWNVR